MGHGVQLDRFAIGADVLSDAHSQAAWAQGEEAIAEAVHSQRSAQGEVGDDRGQQHEKIQAQEGGQIEPTEAQAGQSLLRHQGPADPEPAVDHAEDGQAEDDLAEGAKPVNLLKPGVEIDQEGDSEEAGCRSEKCDRQKEAFGDGGGESHQEVGYNPKDRGEEEYQATQDCEGADAEDEDQRGINQGQESIGEEEGEAET